ncbi:MAG: DUF3306 domain-containing protein [Pseudorhodoplanes sp.]|uniref:DUF3306 domain-containing protein n=1 Tax=Pseudorhodoplanes sp. TaxID=1934341 RepID=UPI003D0E87A8
MTDREDFLKRWARRKREAKIEPGTDPKHEQAAASNVSKSEGPSQALPAHAGDAHQRDASSTEIFDISKLPSLDSIGPATDIRVFMQAGVPQAISRAALRRAWSADPAIRDFIGLSENSWDFTASDGMHGFGALDPAEAKRLLARLLNDGAGEDECIADDLKAEEVAGGPEQAAGEAGEAESEQAETVAAQSIEPQSLSDTEMLQVSNDEPVFAMQQKQSERSLPAPASRRAHGRALPE